MTGRIGPRATRRIAEVRRLRIDAAMLILTDWCAIDEHNFRQKIDEVKEILGGGEVIARTVGGELRIGSVEASDAEA